MYRINEIEIKHISNLTDIQLSKLLHRLIRLEAEKNGIQDWDRIVPFNITTSDGGSDGRAQWKGIPASTAWLKNRYTIFQNKATELFPKDCIEEMLIPGTGTPRKLKSEIERVVKGNGCYILFNNRPIVDKGKNERIEKFREAIKMAGEPNWDTFHIEIYDSNSIKDWVNEYISAVTFVQEFNGIHRHLGFLDWDSLQILLKANEEEYKFDKTIKDNILLIQKFIDNEEVVRITGHSGLGKTRLVFESFRKSLSKNSLVYLNLDGSIDISELKYYIISYQKTQSGIVVVDNCDIKSHLILSELIKASGGLKLISIGLDDSNSLQDLKIKLDRNNQRSIVHDIIQSKLGKTHHSSDIEYVDTVSEGYPWMAVRFCDIILHYGMSELSKIPMDDFIKKLIFRTNPSNDLEYNVIRACSVFSAFGFLDDSFRDVINPAFKNLLKAQMDFIRIRVIEEEISETRFNEICHKYQSLDIIERRGTYYVVKPTILAINLAAEWLMYTDSDKIIEIIKELKLVDLEEKFVDRLRDLDQLDKAKDIVAELWGPGRPFGLAEVLNTSWGSLLFRYVVEVNPIETTKSLTREFGSLEKEYILKINEGRRNLVWALEKLCFRKETFFDAAKVLYSFSVSENETWGNNATNQFKQLFHLFLPGTEATLIERLKLLKWGLAKGDDDYTRLAIEAMSAGLKLSSFSRMGAAEKQGSSLPLKDYNPNKTEIKEYWEKLILLLTEIAISEDNNSNYAKGKVANSINLLFKGDISETLINSIKRIISVKGNFWPEALNILKRCIELKVNTTPEILKEINLLIDILTPTDIKNLLLMYVTKPQWGSSIKDKNGNYIDQHKINLDSLVEKIVKDDLAWLDYVSDLVIGEQRQAFNFGVLVSAMPYDFNVILDKTIDSMELIEQSLQNSEFLGGLLTGIKNKDIFRKTIDRISKNPFLKHHAFYLTRISNPNIDDIKKLFNLVDDFGFSVAHFKIFQYGRALDSLDPSEILSICEKIENYNGIGKSTSFSLLYMYCLGNEDNWNTLKIYLKTLISKNNFLTNDESEHLDWFHWSDTVIKILNEDNEEEFSLTIAFQIIEFYTKSDLYFSVDIEIMNIVTLLFEKFFFVVWPLFSNLIIGEYMPFYRISSLIGSRNGSFGFGEGLLFASEEYFDSILKLCETNPDVAPKRLASIMPLNNKEANFVTWHPLTRKIIDSYGDDEDFLNELSSNMGSFGSIGSSVPYYEIQKSLLEELIDHPIEKISIWSKNMLEYTNKAIKIEKLRDDEQDIK